MQQKVFQSDVNCASQTTDDNLKTLEDDYLFPPDINIALLPPINSVEDLTDEDSGDKEYLNINNLPGSQLLAPAEVMTKDTDVYEDAGNATAVGLNWNASRKIVSADHWDEEDDILLSVFQALKHEKVEVMIATYERINFAT
ncbi:hypothetical protein NQ318_020913 [Aromia moschata]|uniref:Uncharacterized protein n=1 Tax=Aromia moschata TaxID=1265417 RepID=A0AAV8XZD1_9CUCU|nr:hypothetical protein NQ318_020913 [Aromia moschata]